MSLACGDWQRALGDVQWVTAEHLFGFPFAFLNRKLDPLLSADGVFGQVGVSFCFLVTGVICVL